MQIQTLILGSLNTNCYLVSCSSNKETIIIDPADEGDFISQEILKLKLKPKAIILTHAHFDHALAILEVKLNFNIPIILHSKDIPLYKNISRSSLHWLKRKTDPLPLPDQFIEDKERIKFGKKYLTTLETPGHTPGSICLYSKKESLIFTGDTLFKNGIGRTDLSYSNPKDMTTSLKKLSQLPPSTKVFSGHGESTTIKKELSNLSSIF